jgi:hypothetical protein
VTRINSSFVSGHRTILLFLAISVVRLWVYGSL